LFVTGYFNMKIRITICTLLAFSATLYSADSQMLGLVMPDAKFLAGMYPDRLPVSFQQFLLPMFPTAALAEFRVLLAAPALDASHDIHEVLMASADPTMPAGLILARGMFNVSQIEDFLTAQGQTVADYNGVPLISDADGAQAIAFPDGSLAIIGAPADITAAIDRATAATVPDKTLTSLVNELSTTKDAWWVSIFRPEVPSDLKTLGQTALGALAKVQRGTIGVKYGGTVQWTAEMLMDTPQDAGAMANIIRILSSLSDVSQTRPLLLIQPTLKNMVISAKGTTLTLSLSNSSDQFSQQAALDKSSGKRRGH
jgi:hypothetical protein